MGGACSTYGESIGVCRILVGKSEGKRPLGRLRSRREDNIKMNLQEVRCEGMDWIDLGQDRDTWRALVNEVMKFWSTQWRIWLRHSATRSRVPFLLVSLRLFLELILPVALWLLGSTQLLTEMSIRGISWGLRATGA